MTGSNIFADKTVKFDRFCNRKAFLCHVSLKLAICKPQHRNLGIGIGNGNGIGIGTDITNVIISSSIRPMGLKLNRLVA